MIGPVFIIGGSRSNVVHADDVAQRIVPSADNDTRNGGFGNDTLVSGSGPDTVILTNGRDRIVDFNTNEGISS